MTHWWKYQSECILASCALQWHSNKTSIYIFRVGTINEMRVQMCKRASVRFTHIFDRKKKCRQSKVKQVPTQWFFNKHSLRVTTLDNLKHLINPKIFVANVQINAHILCTKQCSKTLGIYLKWEFMLVSYLSNINIRMEYSQRSHRIFY